MKSRPRPFKSFRPRPKFGTLPCVLATAIALLYAPSAQAASGTWNGTTDGAWNGANWSVSPAPGSTSVTNSADTATFNNAGNGRTTITIDANRNIRSLTFDTAAVSYTIGGDGANAGNALLLTSGGAVTLAATASGTNLIQMFNAPLSLGGSYTFTNARADAGSALVFVGNISNFATSTLTLSGAGTGTGNQISGAISDGTGVQSVTITATAGKWTLSGANSYSGLTSITGAGSTTVMGGSNSSSGATTLNSATATLQLDSASNGGLASGLLTLTAGKLEALTSERTLSNAITLTAVTVQGAQNLKFNGKLTGQAGGSRVLTSSITGGNTLTLADVDINTDATARTLTITGTGNTAITGTIANGNATPANGLIITNTGTTTISGNIAYTGTTTIGSTTAAAGILMLSGAGSLSSSAFSVLAGTLEINGSKTMGSTLTLGGGVTGSAANVVIDAASTLTLGGNLTFSATNNQNGATISGATLKLGTPRTFTINDSTNAVSDLTIGATIADGNGIFDVTKAGAGTLVYTQGIDLNSLATPTPTATVSAGTLQLDGSITGGNGIFSVTKAGSGTLVYTPNVALTSNQTATVANGAGTLQFNGVISGSGFGLTAASAGTGVITLTNANTYTGATIANAGGTLKLSGAAASVASSDVTVSGGSTLQFDSSASGVTGTTRAQSVTLIGNATGGSALTVTGNAGADSVDSITNALAVGSGTVVVTVAPNAAKNAQLQAASFARSTGSVVLFRGANLGVNSIALATAGAANIRFTTAPTLAGSGTAGTTTVGILAGAYGDISATGVGNGTATGGLVTYDAANGIRLLNTTTEYKASISDGQTQLDNVRYVNTSGSVITTTLTSDTTINSLSFNLSGAGTNTGVTVGGNAGTTLTISSGVIYTSSSVPTGSAVASDAPTISVPTLSLNGREGTIIAFTPMPTTGTISTAAPLTISGAITNDGGNGLTISGNSTQGSNGGEVLFSGSTSNTYTGATTVNGVVLKLSKTGGAIAIAGDLVLNGGTIYDGNNQIADTSNVTINAGTLYQNGSNNSASGTSDTIGSLTLNGGTISPGQANGVTLTIVGAMNLNASGFTTSSGAKLNVGGLSTFSGGTLTVGISTSPSTFTGVATFTGGLAITNTASGTYTPITINAGGTNLGGKVVLGADVTFTGNATNTNTTTINGAAGTSLGIFALNGQRTFNVGDGAAAVDLTITVVLADNGATVGGLTKMGAGTLKLAGANTYTGPTNVNGGTVEVSGSLSGSTTAPVNVSNGVLQLSASGAVNNASAALTLGNSGGSTSGTLKLADSLSSATEAFGNLGVDFNATIDFGALSGNSLLFAGVGTHTDGATVSILNWSGNALQSGGASDDRLIFSGSIAAFTSVYDQQDVSFNGIGGYAAIDLGGGQYEIVAVPEPSPIVLNLAAGVLGLGGFRRWRRSQGRAI